MTSPFLTARRLDKTFVLHAQGGQALPVMRGLDLSLSPGECLVLAGRSGIDAIHVISHGDTGQVQLGDTWLTLWKFICLERQPVPVAIDRLAGEDDALRDRHALTDMVKTIKARLPWCGQQSGEIPLEEYHQDTPGDDDNSDDGLEALLLLLHQLVLEQTGEPSLSAWQNPDTLQALRGAITLSDEQRLILRMAYVDGLKFSAIARSLNLPTHQPARLAQRAVAHIREVLASRQLLPEGGE